jgi:hypothetical protein
MRNQSLYSLCVLFVAVLAAVASSARAGVFDIAQFVQPGNFALGFEPELTLTDGAGFGANVRYTQGVSDLMNAQAILGTGGGPRRFRVGGNLKFDFIPDIEGQPGIGITAQALYVRVPTYQGSDDTNGQVELTGIPYIHKTFISGKSEINPFVAIPIGMSLSDGNYHAISQFAFGSMFKTSDNFRYTLEVGVAINNTESYLSGGVIYYH